MSDKQMEARVGGSTSKVVIALLCDDDGWHFWRRDGQGGWERYPDPDYDPVHD